MNNRRLNIIQAALFACCLISVFTSWIFVRFIHYHSQNRHLNPSDYNVQVVTEDDYQKLSNPANREVALSDGTIMGKADSWDSKVLPKYKAVGGGDHYVLVTIKGTAPFVHEWERGMIPLITILVVALAFKLFGDRRCRMNQSQA